MLSNRDFKFKQVLIVHTRNGEKICVQNTNILIKDKEDNTIGQSIGTKCLLVLVMGHCSITSGLIALAKKFRFQIILLKQKFRLQTAIINYTEGHTLLRRKQYQYEQLELAKYFVVLKIKSQLHNLKKNRNKNVIQIESIAQIQNLLTHLENKNTFENVQEIMGIEGSVSRIYFWALFKDLNWECRRPRVKHDVTNLLLDIGYTHLFYRNIIAFVGV